MLNDRSSTARTSAARWASRPRSPRSGCAACLDFVKGSSFVYGAKKRVAGLQLVATDMDWTHGDGPEVRGTGEALLMILNGRKDALKDVEGPGKETLAARMA